MDDSTTKMVVFSMIVSMLFPIFSYTFVSFATSEPEFVDVSLDTEKLLQLGITLKDAQTQNITFANTTYTQYDVANHSVRIRWIEHLLWNDVIQTTRQSIVEKFANTWIFPEQLNYIVKGNGYSWTNFHNMTIINNFDSEYNWTLVRIPDEGLLMFIETIDSDDNNITKAVLETGILTISIGNAYETSFSAEGFVDWYWSVLVTGNDFGMPAFMGWLIKLISAYMVLGAILLGRELLPL